MGIATKAELETAVLTWLGRPGDPRLTPLLGDFIRLAEADIANGVAPAPEVPSGVPPLRTRDMLVRDGAFALAGALTDLPTGFLAFRELSANAPDGGSLALVSPAFIATAARGPAGTPRWYCIDGTQLHVAPAPSAGATLTVTYYVLPPLVSPSDCTALLKAAPSVYLFAACRHACIAIGNHEGAARFLSRYAGAAAMQSASDRGTWSGPAPQTRIAGPTP